MSGRFASESGRSKTEQRPLSSVNCTDPICSPAFNDALTSRTFLFSFLLCSIIKKIKAFTACIKHCRVNPLCGTPSLSKLKNFSSFESGTAVLRQCRCPLHRHVSVLLMYFVFRPAPVRMMAPSSTSFLSADSTDELPSPGHASSASCLENFPSVPCTYIFTIS